MTRSTWHFAIANIINNSCTDAMARHAVTSTTRSFQRHISCISEMACICSFKYF